jgi:two-component system CheB/CheR fusion protein
MEQDKSAIGRARALKILAIASHDLRQPLQSLNLLNAALLKTVEDPQARDMLDMQRESLNGMGRLLNTLLDISKLESGTSTASMENLALRPIFKRMRSDFEAQAREKGLELTIEKTREIALSDPDLLAQLLQNLIANAIRYTSQGFVRLSCRRESNVLRIEVQDSGIGIPADQLPHIFNEFHQASHDQQQQGGLGLGLGLGLAIVQNIAQLLGTRVEVESEPGRGSCFSITLPAGTAAPEDRARPGDETGPPDTTGGMVLLIDDEPAVLDASMTLLSLEEDFQLSAAASPAEAYALLEEFTPDLIITDLHLGPGDSGVDIVRAARERSGRMIPAILLTGDPTLSAQQFDLDNLQALCKPLEAEELILMSRRMLHATSKQ